MSQTQKSSRIQDVSKGLNLCFITVKLFTLSQEFSQPQLSRTSPPSRAHLPGMLGGSRRHSFAFCAPKSEVQVLFILLFKNIVLLHFIYVVYRHMRMCGGLTVQWQMHMCRGMSVQWHARESQRTACRNQSSPFILQILGMSSGLQSWCR